MELCLFMDISQNPLLVRIITYVSQGIQSENEVKTTHFFLKDVSTAF